MSGLIVSETLAERLKRADANFSAQRHRALPSGLTSEEVGGIADALLNTLRRTRQTAQNLTPNDIRLKLHGEKIVVEIPDGQLAQDPALEQKALAELLYNLLTGQSSDQPLTYIRFKESYAATLAVIESGQAAKYGSIGELVGAFGWSLYQQQFYAANSLKQPPRSKNLSFSFLRQRSKKRLPTIPATKAFFPIWLIVPFVGLIAFVVFAALNTPAFDTAATKPTSTPKTDITPTPSSTQAAVETTSGSDGSQTTRYNPALNPTTETFQYKAPQQLKAGQVGDLSGGRLLNVTNMQLSVSQSLLYLSLQDGGWEVWDMLSQKRISRRELPNADNYMQVSWSPNGENFVALGLDGQLYLGSQSQIKRVVPYISPDNRTNYKWQFSISAGLFSWSPNSNYLLVSTEYKTLQLWGFWDGVKLLADGSGKTANQSPDFATTAFGNTEWFWSADSRSLAGYSLGSNQLDIYDSSTQRKIYSVDLGFIGASNTEVSFAALLNNLHKWSPDGRFIALTTWQANTAKNESTPATGTSKLVIAELPEQLPNDGRTIKPLNSQVITLETNLSHPANVQLDWSRDNRLMALKTRDNPNPRTNDSKPSSNLDIYARETTEWQATTRINLNESSIPIPDIGKWHPDGQRIILNSRTGWLGLYTIPLKLEAGKTPEAPIVFNKGIAYKFDKLALSPNNKWLVYFAETGNLTVKELATGKITYNEKFADSFYYTSRVVDKFRWSPDSKWLAVHITFYQEAARSSVIRVWQLENGSLKPYGEIFQPSQDFNTIGWDTGNAKPTLFLEVFPDLIIAWDLTNPPPPMPEQITQWNTQVKIGVVPSPQNSFKEVDITQVKLPFQIVKAFPAALEFDSRLEKRWTVYRDKMVSRNSTGEVIIYKQSVQNSLAESAPKTLETIELHPPLTGLVELGLRLTISADGKFIAATQGNGLVQIYNANTGNQLRAFNAHSGIITEIEFSPDSTLLMTTASDGVIKVWEVASGRNLYTLRGQRSGLFDDFKEPIWLSDSQTLLVNSQAGAFFWKLKN